MAKLYEHQLIIRIKEVEHQGGIPHIRACVPIRLMEEGGIRTTIPPISI